MDLNTNCSHNHRHLLTVTTTAAPVTDELGSASCPPLPAAPQKGQPHTQCPRVPEGGGAVAQRPAERARPPHRHPETGAEVPTHGRGSSPRGTGNSGFTCRHLRFTLGRTPWQGTAFQRQLSTGPRGKGPLSVSHYSRAQTSPRHGPCTLLEPQALLNPEAAPWFQWWFILGTPDPSKAPT